MKIRKNKREKTKRNEMTRRKYAKTVVKFIIDLHEDLKRIGPLSI